MLLILVQIQAGPPAFAGFASFGSAGQPKQPLSLPKAGLPRRSSKSVGGSSQSEGGVSASISDFR
jgi:hypothetical protein